jgi:hypothetical protein
MVSSSLVMGDQLAGVGVAGNDDRLDRAVAHVEPQLCLATFRVRAVAEETLVGEDRANVAIKVDVGGLNEGDADHQQGDAGYECDEVAGVDLDEPPMSQDIELAHADPWKRR